MKIDVLGTSPGKLQVAIAGYAQQDVRQEVLEREQMQCQSVREVANEG